MTNLDNANNWWGGEGRGLNRLTILDLIANDTLSAELAALLWLFVENKTSILTAAGPQLAGKTTLITALLDLAPPQYNSVLTQGQNEDFAFLETTDPASAYVLVPELSDHTPAYLWGDSVRTLFDALDNGYSMAATMHADSPEQISQMLREPPVTLPDELHHHIGVIINLRLMYGEHDMVRRVTGVTLVEPGPKFVRLATPNTEDEGSVFLESDESRDAVARRIDTDDLESALISRQQTLSSWLENGPSDVQTLPSLITAYYQNAS